MNNVQKEPRKDIPLHNLGVFREELLEEMITEQNLKIRGSKYGNKSGEGFSPYPSLPPGKRSHSVENNKNTD